MSSRAGRGRARSPSRSALMVLASAVALSGGCGGPMQDEELARSISSLDAIAQEGRLLAQGAAQDRTKKTFTRVHARDLGDEATHEAEKLADAQGEVAAVKARAVDVAQAIAGALGDLEVAPGDERGAATVAADLDDLARRAKRLEEELRGSS